MRIPLQDLIELEAFRVPLPTQMRLASKPCEYHGLYATLRDYLTTGLVGGGVGIGRR